MQGSLKLTATLSLLAYLGGAIVVSWMLAVVLALATSPVYSPYALEPSRPGGISALGDQQLAAGIMWVPGSIPFTIAVVLLTYRWLQPKGERPVVGNS